MSSRSRSTGLPWHYWLVIIASCALLFSLAVLYLTLKPPKVAFSVALYGNGQVEQGVAPGFLVTASSETSDEATKLRKVTALLKSSAGQTLSPGPCPGNRVGDPSVLCFPTLEDDASEWTLEVEAENQLGSSESVVARLKPGGTSAVHKLKARAAEMTPWAEGNIKVEVISPFNQPVANGKARLWVRLADQQGRPLSAARLLWRMENQRLAPVGDPVHGPTDATDSDRAEPDVHGGQAADQVAGEEQLWTDHGAVGPLALVPLDVELRGMGDMLKMQIWPDPTTEITWEQEIHSDGTMELRASELEGAPGRYSVTVRTVGPSEAIFCTAFSKGIPTAYFQGVTKDHTSSLEVTVPTSTLLWLGCSTREIVAGTWAATIPLPGPGERQLVAEALGAALKLEEPEFATYLEAAKAPGETELLTAYMLGRLQPPELPLTRLQNSFEATRAAGEADVAEKKGLLLMAVAVVGAGLVLWAFAVVFLRTQEAEESLSRVTGSGQEFSEEERRRARRRLFWSLMGVVIPALLNIIGLLFLLWLV